MNLQHGGSSSQTMSCDSPTCQQGEFDLRPAVAGDAAAIAAVHRDSFLATYPHFPITRRSAETDVAAWKALWAGRVREPGPGQSTLIAIDEEQIRGFVYFGPSPDADADPATVGQVLSIHVSSDMTRQGVGTLLMKAAIAGLGGDANTAITLWVVADNDGARRFYERLGWRQDGGRRREILAVGDGEGDLVEVIRYRRDLESGTET